MNDLFDYPHARTDDVDTSHEAVPVNLTKQARAVLFAYSDGKHWIDEDAYARVGLVGHQRCSDLRREGLIERTGVKGRTKAGKKSHICRITEAGLKYIAENS